MNTDQKFNHFFLSGLVVFDTKVNLFLCKNTFHASLLYKILVLQIIRNTTEFFFKIVSRVRFTFFWIKKIMTLPQYF